MSTRRPETLGAGCGEGLTQGVNGKLRFPQIWETVGGVMDRHENVAHPDLDAILAADQWARAEAEDCVEGLKRLRV